MVPLLILIPLVSVMVLNLPSRSLMKRIIFPFSLVLFFSQTMLIGLASASFWDKRIYLVDYFFRFNLIVDNLSRVMLLCIGLVLFIALRRRFHDERR